MEWRGKYRPDKQTLDRKTSFKNISVDFEGLKLPNIVSV